MTLDWSNERYVRVYTRDTADLLAVGWEGRNVFWEMMRKCDRAGILDGDAETLPDMLRMPREVVEAGLPRLISRGCVEAGKIDGAPCFVLPNFIEAQEAKQSDCQRQRESRARRRERARLGDTVTERDSFDPGVTNRDRCVTRCHTLSHAVTPSLAVPSPAQPSSAGSRAGAREATAPPPGDLRTDGRTTDVVCDGCDVVAPAEPGKEPDGWSRGLCRECQRHDPGGQTASGEPVAQLANPVARQLADHIRSHKRFAGIDADAIAEANVHLVETGGKALSWLKAAVDECARDAAGAAAGGEPWAKAQAAAKLGRYLWKAKRPRIDDSDPGGRPAPTEFYKPPPGPPPVDRATALKHLEAMKAAIGRPVPGAARARRP